MSGTIGFHNLAKGWNASTGVYEVILGTAFASYFDKIRGPIFAKYCGNALGPFLSRTWPDHYEDEPQKDFFVIEIDKEFPLSEQYSIVKALEKLVLAFENDDVDPRVHWNRAYREQFVNKTRDLISLMRQSLAISETN
jgi:hypothetical protein